MGKKLQILLAVLAVLCLSVSLCSADDHWADVQAAGVIRLGVSSNYYPFVYMEGTALDGLDIALVTEMGKRLGVKVEPVDIAFEGLEDAALIGQIDLIGGAFSITESRKALLDYTNPYYRAGGIMLCRAGQEVTRDTISTARVGVMKGTSFEQWVASNLLMGGQVAVRNVYTYSKIDDVVNALKQGNIDLALIDEDVYRARYKNDSALTAISGQAADETYAFAAPKGSTLIPQLNTVLREMFTDGTAQQIANVYFAKDFTDMIEPSITRPAQAEAPEEPEPADMAISREISPEETAEFHANNPANCYNAMQFVSDISIPDGTPLLPNMNATKTWNIRNTGTCTWDSDYTFNYVRGYVSGDTRVKISKLVAPGETYPVSVNFTTPAANGEYTAFWQMQSDKGVNFGQTIWYDFKVDASTGSSDQQVHTGTPQIYRWNPEYYSTDSGRCPKVFYEAVNAYELQFYIDGVLVETTRSMKGAAFICQPKKAGTYVYAIVAVGGEGTISDAFTYYDETRYPDPKIGVSADFPRWNY